MIYENPKINYEKKYDSLLKDYENLLKINAMLKEELKKMDEFHKLLLSISDKNEDNEENMLVTFKDLKLKFEKYENELALKNNDIENFREILKKSKETFDSIVQELRNENTSLLEQIKILKNL